MDRLRMCHAKAIALEHEKCQKFGRPTPRVEEVLRRALGNYHRLLSAKMKREGIELATDSPEKIAAYAPPLMLGPDIDD